MSLDGNEEHFKRHFAMMPWLALPYEDEARVSALKVRYDVKALPSVTIVDSTGAKVIVSDARQDITSASGKSEDAHKVFASFGEIKPEEPEEVKA